MYDQELTPSTGLSQTAGSATDTRSRSIWGPEHRRLSAGLLTMVLGIAFEALSITATLPVTVAEIGGIELYGWAFSAFMLVNLIGITSAGYAADRRGPAQPFIIGVASFIAGLLIAGAAPSMPVLILGRAFQGLGAGFLYSLALYSVARVYAPALRPRMFALISSAWVIPSLSGPALAGWVAETIGWRWVFVGLMPLILAAAALVLPGLRRLGAVPTADRPRYGSAVALALGTALFLDGLRQPSLGLLLAMVGAGGLLMATALRRLLPPGTLRAAPGVPAAVALAGLLHIAFFGIDVFLPLVLTTLRGQPTVVAGLTLTAGALLWTGGTWVQTSLAPRWGATRLVFAGLGLFALGLVGLSVALQPTVPVVLSVVCWGITGLGMGISFATAAMVVLQQAPAGGEGRASAALQLANVLGTAIGTGVGGALLARATVTNAAIGVAISAQQALMLGVLALAVVAAQRLRTSSQRGPAPHTL